MQFDGEIIVVEWNPPKNPPRLVDTIRWPTWTHGIIRLIEVPEQIHQELPNAEKMPLFEYLGKNVGIRRARGDYILATNPDIVFSRALLEFIAGQTPDERQTRATGPTGKTAVRNISASDDASSRGDTIADLH
jgi:hypothetical protein